MVRKEQVKCLLKEEGFAAGAESVLDGDGGHTKQHFQSTLWNTA